MPEAPLEATGGPGSGSGVLNDGEGAICAAAMTRSSERRSPRRPWPRGC